MHPNARHAARLLGTSVVEATALSGGSLAEVLRVRFEDGREAVVKGGDAPRREARMVRAIRARGVPVPEVIAVDAHVLVLGVVPDRGTLDAAWGDLARVLTTLHEPSSVATPYGWEEDDAFGPLAIPNAAADDWPTFWAERRLLAHAARLPADLARRVERLAADVPGRLPARPIPALLHGDLWTGNVLADGSRVSALIDPACYHGHAEVDLAMLTLFGSPAPAFWDAYPVEPGWHERRPIYQLWPAIVHRLLFGEAYRPMASRLLSEAGA
ncbi:MAG: fructosamine kinase family protein [Trueperaceae bacterium]|nr:fructosamine kinase family protein [Trueperaceae bacterium]